MASAKELIARMFGRAGAKPKPLPRSAVEHDSVDEMVFGNLTDDSPRFRRLTVDEPPQIAPDASDPDPIDFTQATPEEIKEWQATARAAKAAREAVTPYDAWEDLTRDVFYGYHHPREPEIRKPDEVDPQVAHHAKIAAKLAAHPDHQLTRNMTRDDGTASAFATMASVRTLREALEEELVEQARQSEEVAQARDSADAATGQLESLREQARDLKQQGQPIPQEMVQQVREAVLDKRAKQQRAADIAAQVPVPFDMKAAEAIDRAAVAAKEAAEAAQHMPSFGAGLHGGEPIYESPEAALTIADMWANNELLRAVSELYGRLDPDMRFERAKRITGGQEEIVDVTLGDDLTRMLPSELVYLGDEDYEDDWLIRYLNKELLVFTTVGEEHAGRGPVVIVCDESSSMSGERLTWAKAIALTLLNICRREKRDFAYVGFSGGTSVHSFEFPAKRPLDAQQVVDMASHFFRGGTTPVVGLTRAVEIMERAREFKKADIVMVSDGEASFGEEDKRLRNRMRAKGVRFHGIGIGGSFRYLDELCDDVVNVQDFQLEDPSAATAHLATHVT
jgi:uncharacterized protein with von Willebrand factor type A (vWA) domain